MTTVDGPCRNCAGTGWVCENHRDYPWVGMTNGAECCGGAGVPCGACNEAMACAGHVDTALRKAAAAELPQNMRSLPPELRQRMVAFIQGIASNQDWRKLVEAPIEARAIVADPGFPAEVDGDEREVDALVDASRWSEFGAAEARKVALAALRRGKQMAGEA